LIKQNRREKHSASLGDKEKYKVEHGRRPVLMKTDKNNQPGRLKKVAQYFKKLQAKNFTGYIKVNFSQGSIAKVEKFEKVLKKIKTD